MNATAVLQNHELNETLVLSINIERKFTFICSNGAALYRYGSIYRGKFGVADPAGFYLDQDPTFEKKTGFGSVPKKKNGSGSYLVLT